MRALFAAAILACSLLTAVPAQANITYSGCDTPTYLTWKGKKYIARPRLQVTFNGFNAEGSIVAFKRTGQWDFQKLKKK
jgi:hypothetical protein